VAAWNTLGRGYNRAVTKIKPQESEAQGFHVHRGSGILTLIFSAGMTAWAAAPVLLPQPSQSDPEFKISGPQAGNAQPPSPAEMKTRTDELIANQHSDDQLVEQYEHVEREIDRSGGTEQKVLQDRTFRVVPTGTGTLRILLRENGKNADPADYRKQLQAWQDVLELALKPDDPREQSAYTKFEKKKRDRAEMVDSAREAFLQKWIGRETLYGHDCDVIQLDPNPNYHPHSLMQEAVTHFTAKAWVDHGSNQLVHGEARVIRDISVGGGILGKLYRGGVFSFDQAPVAPGVWFPVRYQYDFTGRKFLFTFEVHQVVQSNQYRRVGPPREALATVQNEIASGKIVTADP